MLLKLGTITCCVSGVESTPSCPMPAHKFDSDCTPGGVDCQCRLRITILSNQRTVVSRTVSDLRKFEIALKADNGSWSIIL